MISHLYFLYASMHEACLCGEIGFGEKKVKYHKNTQNFFFRFDGKKAGVSAMSKSEKLDI